MATVSVTKDLDVIGKYEDLVQKSIASESIYVRAKETFDAMVSDGSLDDAKKAELIAGIIGSMASSITNASMSTALEWSKAEKEIELEKLKLAHQLDSLEQDALLKTKQVTQITSAIDLAKVESGRMYGIGTIVEGVLTNISDEGKVYSDIQLTNANKLKVEEEKALVTQKLAESHAAVHKIIADTYTNFGNYTYSGLTSGGLTTVNRVDTEHTSLSDTQQDIAQEQAKGYTYNAWANGLTGSASMLGTALSSGYFDFTAGSDESKLLTAVRQTAENLASASSANPGAIPTLTPSAP